MPKLRPDYEPSLITPLRCLQLFGEETTRKIAADVANQAVPQFRIGWRIFQLDPFEPEPDHASAWDCDPTATIAAEPYDLDIDYEDDTGDWQVLALDRFGDLEVLADRRDRRDRSYY